MDEFEILEAMTKYGGNFVRILAQLYRAGDSENRKRLLKAFPEYFKKYEDIAKINMERKKKDGGTETHPQTKET